MAQEGAHVPAAPVLRQAGDGRDAAHGHRLTVEQHAQRVHAQAGHDLAPVQENRRPAQLLRVLQLPARFRRAVRVEAVAQDEAHAVHLIVARGPDLGGHSGSDCSGNAGGKEHDVGGFHLQGLAG
jgi:hypothetical protein